MLKYINYSNGFYMRWCKRCSYQIRGNGKELIGKAY